VPLQSKAQGRYLNWKFGHEWVRKHHFGGSQKGLPERVQNPYPRPHPWYERFRQRHPKP
jgi:hypothetical protein